VNVGSQSEVDSGTETTALQRVQAVILAGATDGVCHAAAIGSSSVAIA
jgi:hypothetical protein